MNGQSPIVKWLAPIGLAVVAAVFLGLLYTDTILSPDDPELSLTANETVAGTKRWPGTYQVSSQAVVAEGAGDVDVTINVDVFMLGYSPAEIRVKQGQVVKLVLHGLDDGQLPLITGTSAFSGHGFSIGGAYDIWITGLRANVTKEIVFEAAVAGTFPMECTVLCGVAHPYMAGRFVVEEAPQ